jgi:ubiquinone/menaquinone biosynthesis C-methylase UbiE
MKEKGKNGPRPDKRADGAPSASEVFGARADRYDELEVFSEEKYYQPLVDFAAPGPTDRALDLATGSGLLALILAQTARQVTGSDVTSQMLDKARARTRAAGQGNVSFVEAEASNLPFTAGAFDLVTCRMALHHFPEPRKAFAEAYRVLAPGGRLVIADVVGDYEHGQDRALREHLEKLFDPSHILVYTRTELDAMLREAGFETVRQAEPAVTPLQLELILKLENIADAETRNEIANLLKAHLGSDLGGLEVVKARGGIALKWSIVFIAAVKPERGG